MGKRISYLLFVFAALCLVFASCPADPGPENGTEDPNTATGTSYGYENKLISVTITQKDGVITSVKITGEQTPGIGALVIRDAPAMIKEKNSVDAGVDAVTSSTAIVTKTAIKEAGNKAIAEIYAKGGG
ncbi:MAG: FMN-binding protein [Treponema sp.]|jgi:hypothetical protein|nr:FMN-binding protein [Treponema sp.]